MFASEIIVQNKYPPKWTAVGEIMAADIFPTLLVPKPTGHEAGKGKGTTEKRKMKVKKNY